ncbi:TetR/AcrR family transcriptional regulator [Jeotgalibacillus terrae]|uniref:TetR/AcrR family transcriptional regulator n=1 Tax=Jeotgalibacillus terrae TaxID=587735 RepID=A0ABW5ZFL9_9BACL|nr:TetR/AcrR family transcriptional regulator [Jeotgalibacillus terrae]MBM7579394.1 AcrR family transcriptional regulator [Jeotgalibacillus terrae]
MKKEDLRVKRTRKLLFDSLIRLLNKPGMTFEDVTVQQVCEGAMVHRSTFYSHYTDKYDLFTVELGRLDDVLNETERAVRLTKPFSIMQKLDYLEELEHVFLANQNDTYLANRLQQAFKKNIERDLTLLSEEAGRLGVPLELYAEHHGSTVATLHMWWLRQEKSITAEEMDVYFERLMRG